MSDYYNLPLILPAEDHVEFVGVEIYKKRKVDYIGDWGDKDGPFRLIKGFVLDMTITRRWEIPVEDKLNIGDVLMIKGRKCLWLVDKVDDVTHFLPFFNTEKCVFIDNFKEVMRAGVCMVKPKLIKKIRS